MKGTLWAAALLTAALLLTSCGGKAEPPQEYTLGEDTLPSLTALVEQEGVEFEESAGEDDVVTYVYSKLEHSGEAAKTYTETLEKDYDCTIATDSKTSGAPDFTASSGQALAARALEDSDQLFLLTIQWEDDACSVTPTLADQDAMPQEAEQQLVTMEEVIDLLEKKTPAALNLTGTSMEEYLVYAQEGLVHLDDQAALLLNVYAATDHQYRASYLVTVPAMKVYQLNRATGEVTALG